MIWNADRERKKTVDRFFYAEKKRRDTSNTVVLNNSRVVFSYDVSLATLIISTHLSRSNHDLNTRMGTNMSS